MGEKGVERRRHGKGGRTKPAKSPRRGTFRRGRPEAAPLWLICSLSV